MKIDVLDHGYVKFIESWGHGTTDTPEAGIIEAARQSTQGSFRGWLDDRKLLAHLFNNKPQHATPFEFAGMVIEVQAPIFVFREWHRHRTQSYNEMSARYTPLPDLNYTPTVKRCTAVQSTTNKQAQGLNGRVTTEDEAIKWLGDLTLLYRQLQNHYQLGLDIGIPKELARCSMSVARYSRMRVSANLRNWLAFLTLRMDRNAQWEIREFAQAVNLIVMAKFPETWDLFIKSL